MHKLQHIYYYAVSVMKGLQKISFLMIFTMWLLTKKIILPLLNSLVLHSVYSQGAIGKWCIIRLPLFKRSVLENIAFNPFSLLMLLTFILHFRIHRTQSQNRIKQNLKLKMPWHSNTWIILTWPTSLTDLSVCDFANSISHHNTSSFNPLFHN